MGMRARLCVGDHDEHDVRAGRGVFRLIGRLNAEADS